MVFGQGSRTWIATKLARLISEAFLAIVRLTSASPAIGTTHKRRKLTVEQQQELLQIFRTAIQCNVCFENSGLSRGHIKVAHPRPIGPKYLASLMKILVLMINPGKGRSDQDHRDGETRLRAFANGQALIE